MPQGEPNKSINPAALALSDAAQPDRFAERDEPVVAAVGEQDGNADVGQERLGIEQRIGLQRGLSERLGQRQDGRVVMAWCSGLRSDHIEQLLFRSVQPLAQSPLRYIEGGIPRIQSSFACLASGR